MTDAVLENHDVNDEALYRAIGDRYLQYALSIIMDRALPDARDGLKPVQRRILYAMRELKLSANGGFRKCAKIAGDVMGNYHPHGDQAIYDALARLAQEFNVRYPLVDGQGNFGNIDGDRPASSRYTEARLTFASEMLMDGLAEDAVEFRPNYDATREEPVLLPGTFPNLLANGASGIAVGMATNIPPHNIGELCKACRHLIKSPNASIATLMKMVPGPDFPTGGVIINQAESLQEAYAEGRGTIRLRARWDVEKLPRGRWQIIVTEIPYQVKKSKLIESIAALIQGKKITYLDDIRDESVEDIRIVLEPRSSKSDPDLMMESLFRLSDLECRFSLNMNALVDGKTPKVASIRELLRVYLEHRRTVLLRRSEHAIKRIDQRLHLIEGFLVTFLNLDEVIAIIRNEDSPKQVLMDSFGLDAVQAEAILNMRLRSLRKLEEIELRTEQDHLLEKRSDLDDLVTSESAQWQSISGELNATAKTFASSPYGQRRTSFAEAPALEGTASLNPVESWPITVVCSVMGWIRSYKGELDLDQEFKYRDGDGKRFVFHARSSDRLSLFGGNGNFYTLQAATLPSGSGMGEPVRLQTALPNESAILDLRVQNPDDTYLLLSRKGRGFQVSAERTLSHTRNGKNIFSAKDDDEPCICIPVSGDHVALVGTNRNMLVLPLADIPFKNSGGGVILMTLKSGHLAAACCYALADGLAWRLPSGSQRTFMDSSQWVGRRGNQGRSVPKGFPKSNRFF
ncbi:MAG: DNA topoisomerase IV subunit A [Rhodobacteraceae bacterium]|nr:DNA topoisomerase IV subunit A [Paracoccaceae bacterium]